MYDLDIRIKLRFLATSALVLLLCGQATLQASVKRSGEEISLLDAIQLLSKKYEVYFTYDRTLVSDVKVDYDKDGRTSVDTELSTLLRGTDLNFQIFENQFIIIYKEDEEGIKSLRKMKEMMESILARKESQKKKKRVKEGILSPLTHQTINLVNRSKIVASISGTVVDEDNIPLIGVNVRVKNTDRGTATDFNGQFSFDDINENDILVFSYIGYVTEEISVSGRQEITVVVKSDAETLEEVLIVGYGTQKKENVAGAVDQLAGKRLAKRPIANVFQGLQGASPGLNITYSGGQPGATPEINIRGYTSINGGSPLVVIDGIASTTDDLIRLNPADIESISVLRDAASAAIYGARAAYGVVLVKTKEGGNNGRQNISYSNYVAFSKRTVLPEPITDPYIYTRVLETSTDNTPWDYVNYSDEEYLWAKQRSEDPSIEDVRIDPNDPTRWAYMGNTDWNDYFFNSGSFSQYHSVSFDGQAQAGELPINYYLSADYTNENGLNKLAKDDWNRYALRARIGFEPLKWLKIDNNLNIYQPVRDQPTYNITDVYYTQPTGIPKNPDGTWSNTYGGKLAAKLSDGGRNIQTRSGFQNISRAIASFFNDDLTITANASFKRELWKYETTSTKYSIGYGPNDIREEGGEGYVSVSHGTVDHDVFDLYGNYKKELGNHAFSILAGFNQESYDWSFVQARVPGIISSSVPYLALTSGEASITIPRGIDDNNQGGDARYALRSYFGRINYTFKNRYILEGNGRFDGSSRFPTNGRWGFFPSISAAWIVSEESFLRQSSQNTLTSLKLRASYGDLGNQSVGYYGYLQTLPKDISGYLIDGNNNQSIIAGAPELNVDPNNYTWEKVNTTNIGIDMGLFRDKILTSFDYFVRNTTGMLTRGVELPGVLGTSPPQQNAADLATRGWELSVNYRDTYTAWDKPLSFSIKAIVSDSRSEITGFKNDQSLFSTYREGQQIGEIWGLTNNGKFETQEEISSLDQSAIVPWGALEVNPGWPKYKDLDGNGKIEEGLTVVDPKDLSIIGNSEPRYRFGFNMDMSWNNIDLSVFFQGVGKLDYYPHHYLYWGPYQQPYANIYPWNLDFYRGDNDTEAERQRHSQSYIEAGLADQNLNSEFPILQSWMADNNYGSGLDIPQTQYLLNAAYVRLKNLTIGYTLPVNLTKKWKINRLRIFFTGDNLFELSAIKKYLDPESITDGYGWAYPYNRKYAIGINLDL